RYLAISTLFLGLVYTAVITGIGDVLFSHKVKGSIITNNGVVVGSKLIGQRFSDPKFFWGRPSASNFETIPSGASNYGAISKNLKKDVDQRIKDLVQFDPAIKVEDIPAELLLSSGSGLDPHISPKAALFQVSRIAKARRLSDEQKNKIAAMVLGYAEEAKAGFLGQPRVNVLELNMAMEKVLNGK
ncbi:MAG: potassium-transporting ATPase subunit KdpC, partial [bacterium]